MSQAPYMPVFTDALLGDTTHLTAEEFGSYCLILFATWRNNGVPFPDEDSRLCRIVRCTPKRWGRLRRVLVKFFNLDDGTWRQKRLEKEWSRTAELLAAQREKSAHGVAARVSDRRPKSGSDMAVSVPPGEQVKQLKSLKTTQPGGSPPRVKPRKKEESKILEGDRGVASLPAAEPAPAPEPVDKSPEVSGSVDKPEPAETAAGPPTPEQKAEVDVLVRQAVAALRGGVPKGIRDPVAYQAAIKDAKFTSLVKNLNAWAGAGLDGEARTAAWEVLAEAERAGARSGMSRAARKDFDKLVGMYRATGPPADMAQAA